MSQRARKKKMVNWSLQGPIISRLLLHFFAYNVATLFLLAAFWGARAAISSMSEAPEARAPLTLWQQSAPVVIAMLVMTPFMVWDLMRFTNRIAGPLYRFECNLREFVKSGTLQEAAIREGDLLMDFQKQFNEFAQALHALHPDTKCVADPSSSDDESADRQKSASIPSPFRSVS
jgi:hypothetical protein